MPRKHIFSLVALTVAAITHIATSQPAPDGFEEEIQQQTLQGLINGVDWPADAGLCDHGRKCPCK